LSLHEKRCQLRTLQLDFSQRNPLIFLTYAQLLLKVDVFRSVFDGMNHAAYPSLLIEDRSIERASVALQKTAGLLRIGHVVLLQRHPGGYPVASTCSSEARRFCTLCASNAAGLSGKASKR
jgi:hypothetical protein